MAEGMGNAAAGNTAADAAVIDLRPREDVFDPVTRIHTDALHRLFTLLAETPLLKERGREGRDTYRNTRSRRFNLSIDPDRRHDAITITGPRGSGKTTFLLTVLDALAVDPQMQESWCKTLGRAYRDLPRLYPLRVIDPTLIEGRQHIMVLVLDLIWDAVKTEKKQRFPGVAANSRDDRDFSHGFNACEDNLRRCARGLGLLDGIGHDSFSKDWMDADFILDKGLEDARAAVSFATDFSAFVEAALNVLDMDAFVLVIDDIDTRFERGWPVLEAIRKYMVSPHLRIILSGDINLYALMIRRQQWEQMGQTLTGPEQWLHQNMGDRRPSMLPRMAEMVDQLQEQYLTKILPAENRIELHTLEEYVRRGKTFRLRLTGGQESTLEEGLEKYVGALFAIKPGDVNYPVFQSALLRLGLRNFIQVLRSARTGDGKKDGLIGLRHVAWAAMLDLGLRPDDFQKSDPLDLLSAVLRGFAQYRDWASFPRLLPQSGDSSVNLAVLAVTATLVDAFRRDKGAMFAYMVSVAQIRSLADMGLLEQSGDLVRMLGRSERLDLRALIARLAAGALKGAGRASVLALPVPIDRVNSYNKAMIELYGVRHSSRPVAPTGEKYPVFQGEWLSDGKYFDVIYGLNKNIKNYLFNFGINKFKNKNEYRGSLFNSIEDIFDIVSDSSKNVIGVIVYRVSRGSSSDDYVVSFSRIISLMYDLLSTPDVRNGRGDVRKRVENALISIFADFQYPGSQSIHPEDDESQDDEDAASGWWVSHNLDAGLVDALVAWVSHWEAKDIVAPLFVLDRIWLRFMQIAAAIDRVEMVHLKGRYLGWLLRRYTIGFLHACAAELVMFDGSHEYNILKKNPITSDREFENFLLKYSYQEDVGEKILFNIIFSFPLFGFFISSDEHDYDNCFNYYELCCQGVWGDKFLEKNAFQNLFLSPVEGSTSSVSLSTLLNSVPILDQKATAPVARGLGRLAEGASGKGSPRRKAETPPPDKTP